MGLAIRFTSLNALRDFLRWTVQPQVAYAWHPDDRIYLCSLQREVLRGTQRRLEQSHTVHVWLPSLAHDDVVMNRVLALLNVPAPDRSPTLPPEARDCRTLDLASFLQMIKVTERRRASHARSDKLVALFDVDAPALAEAFGSVPKNPEQSSTVIFLDDMGRPSDDYPRYLILLPQADPSFHWGVWLEAENRRLSGDGRRRVQLYTKLPGGISADFYVEHGFDHPLPEVCELYSAPQNALYVLIAGRGLDGTSRTRWLHIVPSASDSHFEVEPRIGTSIDVQLDGAVTATPVPIAPSQSLRVRPRVEPIAGQQRAHFEALERRIQVAKANLGLMEQQLAALSQRHRGLVRLLLRFHQEPMPQGGRGELAHAFQRFLILSRRHLKQFDYVFQDAGPEGGYHVVLTREPVFHLDVHHWLADEVFLQPHYWADWQFNVFVRSDCLLTPRVDDAQIAGPLREALRSAALASDAGADGRPLLLEPDPRGTAGLKIHVVTMPADSDLAGRLDFINSEYPVSEIRSRTAVREELLRELERMQLDLEAEVRAIETALKQQAAVRLTRARTLWNGLAPEIDRVARQLELCGDSVQILEEIVGDFAVTWRAFIDRVLELNRELIEAKLNALNALTRDEREWKKTLKQVVRGNTDVCRQVEGIDRRIDVKLDEARDRYEQAKRSHSAVLVKAEQTGSALEQVKAEVDRLVAEAEAETRKVEEMDADIRDKNERAAELLDTLAELRARLVRHVQRFEQLVNDLNSQAEQVENTIEAMDRKRTELEAARTRWKKEKRDADVEKEKLDADVTRTNAAIEQIRRELEAQRRVAGATAEDVQRKREDIQKEQEQIGHEIDALRDNLAQVHREIANLNTLRSVLAQARADLGGARKDRDQLELAVRKAADELGRVSQHIDGERKVRLEELAEGLTDLATKLDDLAQMELSLRPLHGFRRAVRLRGLQFRTLDDVDPHGLTWQHADTVVDAESDAAETAAT